MTEIEACQNCGLNGKAKRQFRGSGVIEILLWLVALGPLLLVAFEGMTLAYAFWMAFVVPALGYSFWRWRSSYRVCAGCKKALDASVRPTNRAAVAGFIFGLMLQIPLISGIVALVFGTIGKRRVKALGGEGQGLARLAVILGWVNIAAWMTVSVGISLATALRR